MALRHVLLALCVVAVWGFNFVVIQVGLREVPPIFLSALRFVFVIFPAVFFLRRPAVGWGMLLVYGLFMFTLQFAFLFLGMAMGMPAGLASLVLQFQVIVTVVLSMLVLGERPAPPRILGIAIAVLGLGIVAWHRAGEGAALVGFGLVILAACSWGAGNLISKRLGPVPALSLVVWSGLFVPVPLLVLSYVVEGPARIVEAVTGMSWISVGAIAYLVYPTTFFGFSMWNTMLGLYPASTVAPFTLLVPVFGMSFAALVLDEPMPVWKLTACAVVLIGVGCTMLGRGRMVRPALIRGA